MYDSSPVTVSTRTPAQIKECGLRNGVWIENPEPVFTDTTVLPAAMSSRILISRAWDIDYLAGDLLHEQSEGQQRAKTNRECHSVLVYALVL